MWKTIDALGDAYAAGVIDGINCVRRRAGSNDCFDDTNTMGKPMEIHIHGPITIHNADTERLNLIISKITNLETSMLDLNDIAAAVADLNTKVIDLTTTSDGVLLIVTELNATVQALKEQAANTVDPAQKQAIIDQIAGVSAEVAAQAAEMHDALLANTPAA